MTKWTPPGRMRQSITIQGSTLAPDAYGELVPTPTTFAAAFADVRQLSGRELWYARQIQAVATHRVSLRYVPGVLVTMQLAIEGGPTMQIVDVNDIDFRHRELVLLCIEKK